MQTADLILFQQLIQLIKPRQNNVDVLSLMFIKYYKVTGFGYTRDFKSNYKNLVCLKL